MNFTGLYMYNTMIYYILPTTHLITWKNNYIGNLTCQLIFIGLYNTNGTSIDNPPDLEGTEAADGGVVLNKDPVMLLNEFCQRSQQKVQIITSYMLLLPMTIYSEIHAVVYESPTRESESLFLQN